MATTFRQKIHYTATQIGFNAVDNTTPATANSKAINVSDFVKVGLNLATASSANLTFKVKGAIGQTAPDFTAASSVSNPWFYVDLAPLDNAGVVVDGDTGLVWSGTDATRGVEINTDTIDYIALVVTARSAGSITCTSLTATTNG
jgi:hypothetical protein